MDKTNDIHFNSIGNIEIIKASGMHVFPYHTHISFMIGIITSGSGEFNINNKIRVMQKNDCYCVPSNVGISINPIDDFSYISVCFKNELSEYLRMFRCSSYYVEAKTNFLDILRKFENGEIEEKLFVNEIREIFSLVDVQEKSELDYVNEMISYLLEHCDDKFDLDSLSSSVCLSKYHLIRLFKKYMGVTPKQYHQQCKIRKLKEIVLESPQSDIAYALNFSSQSHMESVFKRYMGMTIKEYQNQKKQ